MVMPGSAPAGADTASSVPPPVDHKVVRAFAAMSLAGVVAVVVGYVLVRPRLSAPSAGSCEWDGQPETHDAYRACRRAACDQLNAQVAGSAAVTWIPWLVLLALAIAASWLGWTEVRHHTGRIRYVLVAALVVAWVAVAALFPGLVAALDVLGDCTT